MKKLIKFNGITANQSNNHTVVSMVCNASDVFEIAEIDRIRRSDKGEVLGFQRPKIQNHINEIRDYIKSDDAVLPNPIVLALQIQSVSKISTIIMLRSI